MMWALGHTRVDARAGHFCVILASTIRTLWSWAINNLEEYSKLNMLQDHIYKSKKKKQKNKKQKNILLQEHNCGKHAPGVVCISNMVLEHV